MFPPCNDVGEVIAVRELSFISKAGSQDELTVSIGKPQPFPDSESYFCPFQISGVGEERIKYAAGIDAVQALQLVMAMIGADLKFLANELGGVVSWEGSDQGELGFPG